MTRRLKRVDTLLILLLSACVGRVWLMPLPSSLWVDELVTVFVVRYPGDPSFAVAPQVPLSLYYWLPRISFALFGNSEIALRLPSIVAMAAALFFIARLAARLIHPAAAWFAVFAALAFRNFDYFAVDARPYGLGVAVGTASVLFLIRWLDDARLRDAAVFVLLAALLWRVHLFYWPFYLLYPIYAAIRLARRDTAVKAWQACLAGAAIAVALAPVAQTALSIAREGALHKFNELPTLRNLFYLAHGFPILISLVVMAAIGRTARASKRKPVRGIALTLILAWWLVCPLCLFFYSRLSGNGVLIMRYASLMLPGLALTVTAIIARTLPADSWKRAAVCMACVAIALTGDWPHLWPSHEHDDWRGAAAFERTVAVDSTPILCPSPFIEAVPPVWRPDYPFPSFLYSHLQFYSLNGRLRLFPFKPSSESNEYLQSLLATELMPAGKFVTYGSTWSVQALDRWFAGRPEMTRWHKESARFDSLSVVVYRPLSSQP